MVLCGLFAHGDRIGENDGFGSQGNKLSGTSCFDSKSASQNTPVDITAIDIVYREEKYDILELGIINFGSSIPAPQGPNFSSHSNASIKLASSNNN